MTRSPYILYGSLALAALVLGVALGLALIHGLTHWRWARRLDKRGGDITEAIARRIEGRL